ncbi:hypothetical protein GCM10022393_13370 [Aquimarina addita]|uniref:histidine kinase n=1 Tax=Aquimarina addita TaxID=870485 RepID=A0ABP7XEU7_9FLAO
MFKKNTLLLPVFFIIFLINSCSTNAVLTEEEINWLKDNKGLKVSTYGFYPPYQFNKENETVDGIFIDYLGLIEDKINYKFNKVSYNDWALLMKDAKNGEIDLILEIQNTEKRSAYLNFYSEIFNSEQMIVTRKENINTTSFDNLRDKIVVLPKGFAIVEALKNVYPTIDIKYETNEEECLRALNEGKYDAYIGPKPNSHFYIQNNNFDNLIIGDKTPFNYKPTIAVPKSNIMLSAIIEKAVNNISLEEREVIFNNWLLKKSWPIYYELQFWLFVLFGLGLFIAVNLYHNRRLKKAVIKKTNEIRSALEASKKSNQIKNNFIQNISHEVRTPMNGILGYSELLRKDEVSVEQQKLYANIIIDSGKNLIHIIDNILEISSLQTTQQTIHPELTDLTEVFEDLISQYRFLVEEKKIDLLFEPNIFNQKDLIIIDKIKLIKILRSIIDNAIKFTSEGFVKISYVKKEQILNITIEDTGIGMNSEETSIIFDSFSQLEKEISKKAGGLGLGLTIAKEHVSLLGGEISFTSNENEGSIFHISLPFTPTNSINEKEQKPEKKRTYQVLVAEDEEINFLLVNSLLSRFDPYKFSIIRAGNGKEAVSIFKKNKQIDLILMDIRMPIMDGYEATTIIKKIDSSIPIIAHTAYSSDVDVQNAYHAGCDSVVSKPINLEEFKQTIINYIKKIS